MQSSKTYLMGTKASKNNKQGAAPENKEQQPKAGEGTTNETSPENNQEQTSSDNANKQETKTLKAPEDSKEQSKENETASTPKEVKPTEKEQERLEAHFKKNPMLEKVFRTSDGFFFDMKGLAKNHAKTLQDDNIVVFTKK